MSSASSSTRRQDIEAELGFIVGAGSPLGRPVGVDDFDEHVFGAVLVNEGPHLRHRPRPGRHPHRPDGPSN